MKGHVFMFSAQQIYIFQSYLVFHGTEGFGLALQVHRVVIKQYNQLKYEVEKVVVCKAYEKCS